LETLKVPDTLKLPQKENLLKIIEKINNLNLPPRKDILGSIEEVHALEMIENISNIYPNRKHPLRFKEIEDLESIKNSILTFNIINQSSQTPAILNN